MILLGRTTRHIIANQRDKTTLNILGYDFWCKHRLSFFSRVVYHGELFVRVLCCRCEVRCHCRSCLVDDPVLNECLKITIPGYCPSGPRLSQSKFSLQIQGKPATLCLSEGRRQRIHASTRTRYRSGICQWNVEKSMTFGSD